MTRVFSCIFVLALCFTFPAYAQTRGAEVEYSDGETTLKGYINSPLARYGVYKIPAVIIVHEWWGHNDYVRKRADMITEELGYVAFAIDMFGDGKLAEHPKDAQKFVAEVASTAGLREKRFRAAIEYLKTRKEVDVDKIVAIGYCFGGSTVLDMIRSGVPLQAGVSFHGSLSSGIKAKKIETPIFVAHGEADTFITKEQIAAFKKEMREAEAPLEWVSYTGAKHSFTNPDADEFAKKFGINVGYNERADKDSWEKMKDFFNRKFPNYFREFRIERAPGGGIIEH
ncbi:MAG: dienelactone hydrolase family protein [Bdellovibrionales bacterium]|nr:dienelactone hydrolase family protein [Bdellovibrionales bacterium]